MSRFAGLRKNITLTSYLSEILTMDLKKLYEDIIDLRMEVSYPFLLKIHHDCTEELITPDELKEILKLCISYVLRRAICGNSD